VHDIKVYPDTRHSFFNQRGPAYNQEAADDSWNRVLQFFSARLVARD
jgi:carboxymethylenebutenolidase